MKKLIALLLASVMLVGLFCGCDQGKIDDLTNRLKGNVFTFTDNNNTKYIKFDSTYNECIIAEIEHSKDNSTVTKITTFSDTISDSLDYDLLKYDYNVISKDGDFIVEAIGDIVRFTYNFSIITNESSDEITLSRSGNVYKKASQEEIAALTQKIDVYTAKRLQDKADYKTLCGYLLDADETHKQFAKYYSYLNSWNKYKNEDGSWFGSCDVDSNRKGSEYTILVQSNGQYSLVLTTYNGSVYTKYPGSNKNIIISYTSPQGVLPSNFEYNKLIALSFGDEVPEELIVKDMDTFIEMCQGTKEKGGVYGDYIYTVEYKKITYKMTEYYKDTSKYYYTFEIIK